MKRILCLLLAAFLVGAPTGATAQQERPLLMPQTSSIYQRVLTRHGAGLTASPNGEILQRLPAFQPLYVFERTDGWVRVGPTTRDVAGWLTEADTVAWKQNIVAAFTPASDRQRQTFFDAESGLRALMDHEDVAGMNARLVDEADNGGLAPDSGVVAVEPGEFVNIREELYLMPILDFVEDLHPMTYEPNLLMELASIPLEEEASAPAGTSGGGGEGDFDAGVVFVLDTTQSMEPYIERTRNAIARIVNDIRGTDIGERINFGIVGFRDNEAAREGIGYRTRELVALARRDDQTPVLAALDAAEVSPVSTPGFNEDSLAGVEDAIDLTDWSGGGDAFDGRYVILVTDAGPKDPRDPNARSEIGPAELQADAEGRGIVLMTLHLKTENGQANHDYAAARYRALSRFGQQQFYYGIENGSEEAFEAQVSLLVTALTDHVRAARGEATVLSAEEAGEDLVAVGLAMRLAYLGRREGTQAPDLIRFWVSEKAVADPAKIAFEPRLLITKNELSTMAEVVRRIVELGETMRDEQDSLDFFDQLRSAMAQMAADPNVIIDADADTLGGALEYLERLPYRSQIMDMTPEIWVQSAMQRRLVLDTLGQKLTQYGKWLRDGSVWTPLYNGAPDGEHVFAMPFDILP